MLARTSATGPRWLVFLAVVAVSGLSFLTHDCCLAHSDVKKVTQAKAAESPPEGEDLIRCRHCDEDGRATCTRCDGKKKLETVCGRCDGSGKRPCTVCDRPNDPSEAGPGSIICRYCGGSGVFGAGDRKCPKCGGPGTYKCPTCRGRGELKCKKTLYAGICHVCRFTGKSTCQYCAGKKWISRSKLNTKGSATDRSKSAAGTSRVNVAQNDDKPTAEQLEQRFAVLTELRLTASDLDTATLRRTTDEVVKKTKEVGRQLKTLRSPDSEIGGKVLALRQRVEALETRARRHRSYLGEIDTLVIDFDARYSRCQKRLANRPPGPYKTGSQKRRLASWVTDMTQSVAVCERRAVTLEADSPAAAVEATHALDAELQRILDEKRRSEELVASVQATAKTEAGKEDAAKLAASVRKRRGKSAQGDARSGSAETAVERAERKSSRDALVGNGDDSRSGAEDANSVDETPGAADDEPSDSSPLLFGFLSALGGFGIATVVFVALGRRRRRLSEA